MSSFNLLKDLSFLQTEGGAVRKKLKTLWTERNKCCLWKLSDQILAAHSFVLDTSAGFSSARELKNYLKTSSPAMEGCVSENSFGSFVAKWSTYSLKVSLFVFNVIHYNLMIWFSAFYWIEIYLQVFSKNNIWPTKRNLPTDGAHIVHNWKSLKM